MKRLLLLVVCAALASVASAQLSRVLPGVDWTKRSQTLPKDVENFAIVTMNWTGAGGKVTRASRYVGSDNDSILLDTAAQYDFDTVMVNLGSEHIKLGWVRPKRQNGKPENIRNDGGSNHTRQVFNAGFKELDVYNYGQGRRGFGGPLCVADAALGQNGIYLLDEEGHVDQHNLGGAQIGSQKRRGTLEDAIPVLISHYDNFVDLFVDMVKNGWVFEDPVLQRKLETIAQTGVMPSDMGSTPAGGGQHQTGGGANSGGQGGHDEAQSLSAGSHRQTQSEAKPWSGQVGVLFYPTGPLTDSIRNEVCQETLQPVTKSLLTLDVPTGQCLALRLVSSQPFKAALEKADGSVGEPVSALAVSGHYERIVRIDMQGKPRAAVIISDDNNVTSSRLELTLGQ